MASKSFPWYPCITLLLGVSLLGIAPAQADQCQASLNLPRPCTPAEQAEYERLHKAKEERTQRKVEEQKAVGGFGEDLSPEEQAKWEEVLKKSSKIRLESNGQTFTFNVPNKVGIFLDDQKYPVDNLTLTCKPKGVTVGYIHYPIYGGEQGQYPMEFVANKPGRCVLKNKDFAVTIIVLRPKPAEDQDRNDQHDKDDHPKAEDHDESNH